MHGLLSLIGNGALAWWPIYLLLAMFALEGVRILCRPPRPDLNRAVGPVTMPPNPQPSVSFLVPAWNAADDIGPFIECFRNLSWVNKELVLCVGGSDNGLDLARSFANGDDVVVLRQRAGMGKQRALDECFKRARGEIIYLTDVDCRPDDVTVMNLLGPLIRGECEVVTGNSAALSIQLSNQLVQTQDAIDRVHASARHQVVQGLSGCNTALTRRALLDISGFCAEAPSGTDYVLAQELRQAHYAIHFVPGCPMPTRYTTCWHMAVRQQRRWVRNIFRLGRRYGVRRDVQAATRSFSIALLWFGASMAGFVWWPGFVVAFGGLAHGIGSRVMCQRQMGRPVRLLAAADSFLIEQLGVLWAILDVVSGKTSW
jgi:glycosyltransferase involved in cell wall biosynthesis